MDRNLFYEQLEKGSEPSFNISEWTQKLIKEVNETNDKFIFTTIQPFINSITTMEISKEELSMAIALIRRQKEAIEKFGVPISDDWNTAVQQSAALQRAYDSGFRDGVEDCIRRLKEGEQ